MLFILYLKRIVVPLSFAIAATLIVLLSAASTIVTSAALMSVAISQLTAYNFFHWLLKKIVPQLSQEYKIRLSLALSTFASCIAVTLLEPHLFLFFNALPFLAALTILSLSAFLITFELAIHIPKLYLGAHYSLLKIILHPTNSMRRLKRMLKPGIDSLKLEASDRQALETRQQTAIAGLPKEAIIDDVALYRKHLQLESRRVVGDNQKRATDKKPLTTLETNMQPLNIKMQALYNAKAEANALKKTYLNTLTPTQQARYEHYRALTCEFSPPYAECLISGESVNDVAHNRFVIVEKRFSDSNSCVPAKTFFWHDENGFQPLFQMHDPSVPTLRDRFSLPRDEKGQTAEYFYHSYSTIHNHGLSLQLCEAIESFNASLKLSANRRRQEVNHVQHSTTSTPRLPRYRAPAEGACLSQRNMFAFEPDNSLADLHLSEEERKIICGSV
ncbi:MAG: hypothetical protein NTU48_07225 [Legionellales bacterium]|nr:hypothetical protein [Legionellales bacterium]